MGSLCWILITRQPAPPVKTVAYGRALHGFGPGLGGIPRVLGLIPCLGVRVPQRRLFFLGSSLRLRPHALSPDLLHAQAVGLAVLAQSRCWPWWGGAL